MLWSANDDLEKNLIAPLILVNLVISVLIYILVVIISYEILLHVFVVYVLYSFGFICGGVFCCLYSCFVGKECIVVL